MYFVGIVVQGLKPPKIIFSMEVKMQRGKNLGRRQDPVYIKNRATAIEKFCLDKQKVRDAIKSHMGKNCVSFKDNCLRHILKELGLC